MALGGLTAALALAIGLIMWAAASNAADAESASSRVTAVDFGAKLRIAPCGFGSAIVKGRIEWRRVARVDSSCECSAIAPVVSGTDGPGVVSVDLTKDPEARSFAPTFRLFDAQGAIVATVVVDVEVTRRHGAP